MNLMKKILFLATLLLTFTIAHSQTIQSKNYGTTGYIKSNGTIQTSRYKTVGYIKNNGTIQNSSYRTIGYIKSNGTIQNSSYSTVGYVKKNGTVQDSSYRTLGYIKDNATVQNSNYSTLGYAKGVKKEWLLLYFSFLSLSEKSKSNKQKRVKTNELINTLIVRIIEYNLLRHFSI